MNSFATVGGFTFRINNWAEDQAPAIRIPYELIDPRDWYETQKLKLNYTEYRTRALFEADRPGERSGKAA